MKDTNSIEEGKGAAIRAAVEHYKKMSGKAGLTGSLVANVAHLFGLDGRELMRALLRSKVPLDNSGVKMAEEKKKKKPTKTKKVGGVPDGTSAGYSGNGGATAAAAGGAGGAVGAVGESTDIASAVKAKFKSMHGNDIASILFNEASGETTIQPEQEPELPNKTHGLKRRADNKIRQAGQKVASVASSLVDESSESHEFEYEIAKSQSLGELHIIVKKHKGLITDPAILKHMIWSAKERAKDFGHYGPVKEAQSFPVPNFNTGEDAERFIDGLHPDMTVTRSVVDPDSGEVLFEPGETKRKRAKAEAAHREANKPQEFIAPGHYSGSEFDDMGNNFSDIRDEMERFYHIVWKPVSTQIDFSDMGLEPEYAERVNASYDLAVNYPALIKRKDGNVLSEQDFDNIGSLADSWNDTQQNLMSNQLEIMPMRMEDELMQFIVGVL